MKYFFMPLGTCSVWGTENANVGFHIKDELRAWLEDNDIRFRITYASEAITIWEHLWRPVIEFEDDDQAMLFKLTWL